MSSSERPEWLPSGWTIEVKSSDGGKCNCYIDPESGREFYSMLEVSRYLNPVNSGKASEKTGDKSSSEPGISENSGAADVAHKISKKKQESIQKSNYKKVISRTPADGLPPGWIKEIRIRGTKGSRKKDPFYLDPSSDYVFFSKLDALRYLDTGDIETCAMKPTKRDISENEMKPVNTTTRRQLFEGDILQEMKSPEKKLAKHSNQMNKSKKSSATPPCRSSKRLKGLEPETKSDPSLNEEAIRAQSEVKPEREKNEGSGHLGFSGHLGDTEEVKGKQQNVEKPTNDEKTEPQLSRPHCDLNLTDPCLDFAVRTLRGEIPFEVPSISASLQQESVAIEARKKDNAMKTEA